MMKCSRNTSFQPTTVYRADKRRLTVVRASSSDLQKPVAKPVAPSADASAASSTPSTSATTVTIEYQRQQAKAMQQYFRDLKLEETVADSQLFGWTKKNEIGNGRWVMMGLAIGLLTEYATAVNFVDQIKLMVSYLGIADLQD